MLRKVKKFILDPHPEPDQNLNLISSRTLPVPTVLDRYPSPPSWVILRTDEQTDRQTHSDHKPAQTRASKDAHIDFIQCYNRHVAVRGYGSISGVKSDETATTAAVIAVGRCVHVWCSTRITSVESWDHHWPNITGEEQQQPPQQLARDGLCQLYSGPNGRVKQANNICLHHTTQSSHRQMRWAIAAC